MRRGGSGPPARDLDGSSSLSPEHETDVLVNPRVVCRSEQLALFTEGCLSFNAVAVDVRRPYAVRVDGYDVHGNERESTLSFA